MLLIADEYMYWEQNRQKPMQQIRSTHSPRTSLLHPRSKVLSLDRSPYNYNCCQLTNLEPQFNTFGPLGHRDNNESNRSQNSEPVDKASATVLHQHLHLVQQSYKLSLSLPYYLYHRLRCSSSNAIQSPSSGTLIQSAACDKLGNMPHTP